MSAPVTVDLTGQTAIVTGANTGIGLVTARELARAGAAVVLACRSESKAAAAMAEIRSAVPDATLSFLALDLGDFAAIRAAAKAFLASGKPLHLLVNNAGLAGARGVTKDGFEIHLGTNHLGPYLLTRLLLPALRQAPSARVVVVASRAHRGPSALDFEAMRTPTRSRTGVAEYGVSKLCNVLFARSLAKRLAGTGITVYSLHPGVVASDIWRRIPQPFRWLGMQFMITNEEGALTTLHCATSPAAASETGLYYDRCRVIRAQGLGCDDALAEALWARSAAWTDLPVEDADVAPIADSAPLPQRHPEPRSAGSSVHGKHDAP